MTITLDVHMAAILEKMRAAPGLDPKTLPLEEGRKVFTRQQSQWVWSPTLMASETDLDIPGDAGVLKARLFLPQDKTGLPVILFVHGGGWTFGNIETHSGTMRALASASGCAVLGLNYRLSPEHAYPEPIDDVRAALHFIERGGLGPSCDPTRVALAGDSAGANLALGTLIARRDAGERLPKTAALFYGCFAPDHETESHKRFGDGALLLSTEGMRWYWKNFLGKIPFDQAPPAAAPLRARLEGLPPLYLNAAGLDPLLDDTTRLVARLSEAGVPHRYDFWPGVTHGFLRLARELPAARAATTAAGQWLAQRLNDNQTGRI